MFRVRRQGELAQRQDSTMRALGGAASRGMVLTALLLVIAGAGWWYVSRWARVEPGNAGVLMDYCTGEQQTITDSRYVWVDWRCERLAQYPTAEYTYSMTLVSGPNGGSEAVPCVMKDQQTIAMDSSTSWSVDPQRVADLYRMRPGVLLVGDPKGQDLANVLVRPEIRAGLRDACTKFGWEEAYGPRRLEYEAAAEQAVRGRLEPVGIKVRSVSIRAMVPSTALEGLISARLEGQKLAEAATFQQLQAERDGLAKQANARAAAQVQMQQARAAAELQEQQSTAALAKAKADAEQARITAESEAARIRTLGDAEAYANRQKATTITPEMVDLEKWRRWDGKMPQMMLGNDTILQVPSPNR